MGGSTPFPPMGAYASLYEPRAQLSFSNEVIKVKEVLSLGGFFHRVIHVNISIKSYSYCAFEYIDCIFYYKKKSY